MYRLSHQKYHLVIKNLIARTIIQTEQTMLEKSVPFRYFRGKPKAELAKKEPIAVVSFVQLFRYAKIWEICLTLLGMMCGCVAAFGIPFNVIIYGEFTSLLVDRSTPGALLPSTSTTIISVFGGGQLLANATREENRLALIEDSKAFGIGCTAGAVLQCFFCVLAIDLINFSAMKQISRIRLLFLQAALRQDMTWYDTTTGNNFATKITDDLEKLKEGIADKLAICSYLISSCVVSILFAFVYGWKLTLVVLSCAPLIIVSSAFVAKMQSSLTVREMIAYSKAGAIAEEVLTSIRTVVAFGGEKKEVQRYRDNLAPCERTGFLKGIYSGIGGGSMWFCIYSCYGLAIWYGMELILGDRYMLDKEYTPAVLVIVLFGVLMGAQNLGFTAPHLEAFASAKGAAKSIFDIIDRRPIIDAMSEAGLKPKTIVGDIEFRDVHFDYPARLDVRVLDGFNLNVRSGQTVALVGMSGCGKSTCLQLLQRLYDPTKGTIFVDNVSTSDYNTSCLRSFIGVVGQEPVLFSTSIAENIRYGKSDATLKEIKKACRIANCHGFISKLPGKYDTLVGERGGALSGGQKQRIAIARALIRDPVVLVLDEATSALDPHSERLVQDALDRASMGRTTIVISHRLSTIKNADKIVFVESGQVIEQGTHSQLLSMRGKYFDLVAANNTKAQEDEIIKECALSRSNSKSLEAMQSIEEKDVADEVTEDEDKGQEVKYDVPIGRLLGLSQPEWKYNFAGSVAAFIVGSSLPLFAIIFGEFYGLMSLPDETVVRSETLRFSIYFLLLGLLAGTGTFLQTFMFNVAGVKMTSRLRSFVFETAMKQEIGWFDDVQNGVGVICARLSGDCASVQGACGTRLGVMMQAFSTLIIGVSISLFISWKLTSVAIVSIPVVLAACYFESKYTAMSSLKEKQAMERGVRMAVEAIANIRTVASLGQEAHVLRRYTEEIENAESACLSKIRYRGTVFGLGQTVPFLGYALAFYYGGTLVANDDMEYKDVIKVSETLIFGAWMLAQALSYAPNVNVAILSAGRLLRLIDRVPQYRNPENTEQREIQVKNGDVNFSKLAFSYPTRKDIQIMNDFELSIPAGKTIALVGPSGCGKSTCIQLLLRYYDPDSGAIQLDGQRNTDFTLASLRAQIGLVSQEPVLFDRTIAENIAYGDNRRDILLPEIIEAARKSNIHDFVISLPLGYETRMGTNGAQMSGGQKQRVAIARALVRNPKILLLDEATSALDSHSESVVQAALDLASQNRTCITIAHRLSTVQNADMICVIQNGVIVEKGKHDELMRLGKMYRKLYQMQQVH